MSLAGIMNDTFDIVEKADQLRRESKSKIIVRMVQQTTECAWFIRDYMKLQEFCMLHVAISLFILCSHSLRRETNGQERRIQSKGSS
jgi:hypothetical protein